MQENLKYFQHAMSFIEKVKRIHSLVDLTRTFTKYIEPLGFDQFSCASFCDVTNPQAIPTLRRITPLFTAKYAMNVANAVNNRYNLRRRCGDNALYSRKSKLA